MDLSHPKGVLKFLASVILAVGVGFGGAVLFFYLTGSGKEIKPIIVQGLGNVVNKQEEIKEKPIELILVGDIMLARGIGQIMAKNNDWKYPFYNLANVLNSADVAFGNLESPISSQGVKVGSIYSFRADPKVIEGLEYAGFDILSVANNHAWDYTSLAFSDTLKLLSKSGINYIGGGPDYNSAHESVIKEIKGTKIAFLGYTDFMPASLDMETSAPALALLDLKKSIKDIKAAKEKADLVVVSVHWGEEYQTTHNQRQADFAHAFIDAGADIVVGHHSHVVQDTEEYSGGFIIYSLGNFVFDQNFSKDTEQGMIIKVSVTDKKISEVEPAIIKFDSLFRPFLVSS